VDAVVLQDLEERRAAVGTRQPAGVDLRLDATRPALRVLLGRVDLGDGLVAGASDNSAPAVLLTDDRGN
jgi:hypothetical protein